MKSANIIRLLFLFLLLPESACGEKADETSHLGISPDILTFWPEASTKTATVSGRFDFTAETENLSDRSWCSVKLLSGETDNVSVSVAANEQANRERSAKIVVSAEGTDSRYITVRQTAPQPQLSVKEKRVIVNEAERLGFSLEVSANIPVAFDLPAWITRQTGNASATGVQVHRFAVTPVSGEETSREGVVTVKSADASFDRSVMVEVRQMSAAYFIRAMSYNIRNGTGMDNITDYGRIAQVINSVAPDVVALQELDSVTSRSKGADVLSILASQTGMNAVFCAAIPLGGGKYGIGILSKEKPLSVRKIALPGTEEKRACLLLEFKDYVYGCTHFSLTEADRLTSVGMINEAVASYDKPVVLAGDMNASPQSSVMQRFAQNWKFLSDGQSTFPSDSPVSAIDYILGDVSKGFDYAALQYRVLTGHPASDHLPVFADIRLLYAKRNSIQ
jgi:endonuclease/exonuclease/phosphatase family metal-dependent hydrolase